MLIVAIPKSASTSLMDTLGKTHRRSAEQLFFGARPLPEDFRILPRFHSDMRELTAADVEQLVSDEAFYKQHVLPTANNLALLRTHPKVLLFRDPSEIVAAYWRAINKGIHDPLPEFADATTLKQWIDRAAETGLCADLDRFHSAWSSVARAEPTTTLSVSFEQVVADTAETIHRIEEFFGLPVSRGEVRLSKKRFSRRGRLTNLWENRLQRKLHGGTKRVLEQVGMLEAARTLWQRLKGHR